MQLIDLSDNNKFSLSPSVATLGFFDGVHKGHRYLLEQVINEAKGLNLPSAVITFPVHPRKVLNKEFQPQLLCGYQEKIHLLSQTGIDYCICLPFTRELSNYSAEKFITEILHQKLHLHSLVVGYDHRFGHNRQEDFNNYTVYGKNVGINVIKGDELPSSHIHVSSSIIRRQLQKGDLRNANTLLSYTYTLTGKVISGSHIGRTIGFPTANIGCWEEYKVIPPSGVYAVVVHVAERRVKGMLYIGTRPTLNEDDELRVEVNLFDFSEDIYNQTISVEFVDYIRPDEKFSSLDALIRQLRLDKQVVLEKLRGS